MFGGVPDPLIVAFYTVIPVLPVYVAYLFSLRVRNWERGTPDGRRTTGVHRFAQNFIPPSSTICHAATKHEP